jgi:hypothetical protein
MSTLHCPLCGLFFRYSSELDGHAREDHGPPGRLHVPPPAPRREQEPVPEQEPVLHLPW